MGLIFSRRYLDTVTYRQYTYFSIHIIARILLFSDSYSQLPTVLHGFRVLSFIPYFPDSFPLFAPYFPDSVFSPSYFPDRTFWILYSHFSTLLSGFCILPLTLRIMCIPSSIFFEFCFLPRTYRILLFLIPFLRILYFLYTVLYGFCIFSFVLFLAVSVFSPSYSTFLITVKSGHTFVHIIHCISYFFLRTDAFRIL